MDDPSTSVSTDTSRSRRLPYLLLACIVFAPSCNTDADTNFSHDALAVPCWWVAGSESDSDVRLEFDDHFSSIIHAQLDSVALDGLQKIDDSLKSVHSAEIHIQSETGRNVCDLNGHVRISGQLSDHLGVRGSSGPSLHVSLDNGALFGSTEFRLFSPRAKNFLAEIVAALIFETAGLYRPELRIVQVTLGGLSYFALLQDFDDSRVVDYGLRSGPIYDFNEDALWAYAADYEDPTMVFQTENESYSRQSRAHLAIALEGLAILNDSLTGSSVSGMWGTRAPIVSPHNAETGMAFGRFNLLAALIGGGHGLQPHNRFFTFDPFSKTLIPLWNDFNPTIFDQLGSRNSETEGRAHAEILRIIHREPEALQALLWAGEIFGPNFWASFEERWSEIVSSPLVQKYLDELEGADTKPHSPSPNIDSDVLAAVQHSKIFTNLLRRRILDNLRVATQAADSSLNDVQELDASESSHAWGTATGDWVFLVQATITDTTLDHVASGSTVPILTCLHGKFGIVPDSCSESAVRGNQLRELMQQSGQRPIPGSGSARVVFRPSGTSGLASFASERTHWRTTAVGGLLVSPGVTVETSRADGVRHIDMIYLRPEARAVFLSASLNNSILTVSVKGSLLRRIPDEHEITRDGLTGCLSFINSSLREVSIIVEASFCEDGIHFDSASGSIDSVYVSYALADAIDADRSVLSFGSVQVESARNDCVDFSDGVYLIESVLLRDCADKAISLGEDSTLSLWGGYAQGGAGLVVKDGSELILEGEIIVNAPSCSQLYNKKYGFSRPNILSQGFAKCS